MYDFKNKTAIVTGGAQGMGREYVRQNLAHPISLRVRAADEVGDRIFVDGNSAAALGSGNPRLVASCLAMPLAINASTARPPSSRRVLRRGSRASWWSVAFTAGEAC